MAELLSKEISALANSEGGQIVIGLKERKEGKTHVADDIDEGIDPSVVAPEWVQQLVDSNLSPYLPGIKVRRVLLTGARQGRVALVIAVPQGATAYQARDKRYYGRSESQVQALPDHEIRMRMMRGRIPYAGLELANHAVLTAEGEWVRRLENVERWRTSVKAEEADAHDISLFARRKLAESEKALQSSRRDFDEHLFRLQVVNTGEITIRDFLLAIRFETELPIARLGTDGTKQDTDVRPGELWRYRFAKSKSFQGTAFDEKIFPGDRVSFPDFYWRMQVPTGVSTPPSSKLLSWVLYLDDAPSMSGEILLPVVS